MAPFVLRSIDTLTKTVCGIVRVRRNSVTLKGNDLRGGLKDRYVSGTKFSFTVTIFHYHVVHNRTRTKDAIHIITMPKSERCANMFHLLNITAYNQFAPSQNAFSSLGNLFLLFVTGLGMVLGNMQKDVYIPSTTQ